jgi:hypothetical protein
VARYIAEEVHRTGNLPGCFRIGQEYVELARIARECLMRESLKPSYRNRRGNRTMTVPAVSC